MQILKALISHSRAKINAQASSRQEKTGAGDGEELYRVGWLLSGRRTVLLGRLGGFSESKERFGCAQRSPWEWPSS